MKRNTGIVLLLVLVLGLAGAYAGRGTIRDAWDAFRAPALPAPTGYRPGQTGGDTAGTSDVTTPFEGGYSTSQNYILETAPKVKPPERDPLAFTGTLPQEVNLDVPFTTQAPFSNWDNPYQEACEEASSIMVDAFYRGKTGVIAPEDADTMILKIVAYEKATFGFYEDTTAQEVATLIRNYYGYERVIVKPLTTVDDLKVPLALGYPVMVPMAGKLLNNPNFKNGGPPYHMVVLRGYTPTMFITNDPGTRKGEQYVYDYDTIMNAAHDWTGDKDTIATGKPVMIVVIPNTK